MGILPVGELQALMSQASSDPDARNRVLVELRSLDVWAATWPTDPSSLRTLRNSQGLTALAVFTDMPQLEEAAIRYAWLGVDGSLSSKTLPMVDALAFAKGAKLAMVVVDIAGDHSMEIDEGDMEILLAQPKRSTRPPSSKSLAPTSTATTGPGPGQHRYSQHPSIGTTRSLASQSPSSSHLRPASVRPAALGHGPQAVFGAGSLLTLHALTLTPSQDLLNALGHVLRAYPEVEWACLVAISRDASLPEPVIGLRVEAAFRVNVNEILVKLREAAVGHGLPLDVLVLDDAKLMKEARALGKPFYPWRK